jgi:hypothetical protein
MRHYRLFQRYWPGLSVRQRVTQTTPAGSLAPFCLLRW